jgi:tetratricopeptide (TPR) repeat protein
MGLVSLYVVASASGCSTLTFWRSDDPAAVVADGASPGRVADALRATREKMALAPQEPYWKFRMGELYATVDSTGQAFSYLTAALAVDSTYAPAVALLSKIYYMAGQFEPATALLDNFIAHNPAAPDALRAALALHLEALGDVDRARSVLDGCSAGSKEARAARTFVTLRGDESKSVLDTAKQVLDDNPRSAANHNNYGIALLHAGRPYEAREAFLEALDINEKLPGAMYNMAILETFYFFDKNAGRGWFTRYKRLASDDPDDLASVFGSDVSKLSDREPAK